jgi:hypothetical protein
MKILSVTRHSYEEAAVLLNHDRNLDDDNVYVYIVTFADDQGVPWPESGREIFNTLSAVRLIDGVRFTDPIAIVTSSREQLWEEFFEDNEMEDLVRLVVATYDSTHPQ